MLIEKIGLNLIFSLSINRDSEKMNPVFGLYLSKKLLKDFVDFGFFRPDLTSIGISFPFFSTIKSTSALDL